MVQIIAKEHREMVFKVPFLLHGHDSRVEKHICVVRMLSFRSQRRLFKSQNFNGSDEKKAGFHRDKEYKVGVLERSDIPIPE